MPNNKKMSIVLNDIGLTIYCIIGKEVDGYLLDAADGTFAAAPADSYLSLAALASPLQKMYTVSENRQLWADGKYIITFFRQLGGAPDTAVDDIVGAGELFIHSDTELSHTSLKEAIDKLTANVTATLKTGVLQSIVTITDETPQEIVRGDKKKLAFSLGVGWDLTGRKAYFIAKQLPTANNSTAIINRECTITDEVNGLCEIILTEAETAVVDIYHAEVEVRDSDESNPQTALQFKLKILQDVRQ